MGFARNPRPRVGFPRHVVKLSLYCLRVEFLDHRVVLVGVKIFVADCANVSRAIGSIPVDDLRVEPGKIWMLLNTCGMKLLQKEVLYQHRVEINGQAEGLLVGLCLKKTSHWVAFL